MFGSESPAVLSYPCKRRCSYDRMVRECSDQPTGRLALVFELMDMNIYELIRGRRNYVAEDRIKSYMYQLMKGSIYLPYTSLADDAEFLSSYMCTSLHFSCIKFLPEDIASERMR